MFGLFKAKPPVGPWEKAWVEHRMCWLTEQFGMTRLLEARRWFPTSTEFRTSMTKRPPTSCLTSSKRG